MSAERDTSQTQRPAPSSSAWSSWSGVPDQDRDSWAYQDAIKMTFAVDLNPASLTTLGYVLNLLRDGREFLVITDPNLMRAVEELSHEEASASVAGPGAGTPGNPATTVAEKVDAPLAIALATVLRIEFTGRTNLEGGEPPHHVLARVLGIASSTARRRLAGLTPYFNVIELATIAEYLDTTPQDLIRRAKSVARLDEEPTA